MSDSRPADSQATNPWPSGNATAHRTSPSSPRQLGETSDFSRTDWLRMLLEDQRQRWRSGKRLRYRTQPPRTPGRTILR